MISDTNSEYPTLKMDEIKKKNNKPIEEKCKNYTHLPVYDASMERRRAKERQATVSSLFSDMDKQLSSVSDLTSSHMANKGITLRPSLTTTTPFDEPATSSASRTQETKIEETSTQKTSKEPCTEETTLKATNESTQLTVNETSEQISAAADVGMISVVQASVYSMSAHPDCTVSAEEDTPAIETEETYESLGHTFRNLTEKIQIVTNEINSNPDREIPFMDDGDTDDYEEVIISKDTEDGAADEMLTKVLGKLLDPALAVGKIQLAPSPSSPNLVLPSLSCQGTDTLHRSGSTVRRDYTDI